MFRAFLLLGPFWVKSLCSFVAQKGLVQENRVGPESEARLGPKTFSPRDCPKVFGATPEGAATVGRSPEGVATVGRDPER